MAIAPVMSPERKARRRKIKKMTGHESDYVSCTGCHREFSNYEIDNDEVIAVIGRCGGVTYCKECFRKEFLRGALPAMKERPYG